MKFSAHELVMKKFYLQGMDFHDIGIEITKVYKNKFHNVYITKWDEIYVNISRNYKMLNTAKELGLL